jgi:hypothetical protein
MNSSENTRVQDFIYGHEYGVVIFNFIVQNKDKFDYLKSLHMQLKSKGWLSAKQIQVVLRMREANYNG